MPITESPSVAINGREVRRRRKMQGYNLAPFAAKCQISEAYLSHIETGKRTKVAPRVFGAICTALGVEDRQELVISDEVA
ncbi:MAG TPA: helix-turn-helix transcriptional regulator [Actinophytocola sp.]|uniref:helix-turn-helix domain-containing protein n=1 Tax=Actinophytocola sp. TaxID=1872138 RepID=UPI002DDDA0A8|nr:helix-turn-helix transcriptional regulator [Actinophytocola sp.]HEV2780379.1 helix-turn-helix transcriptional regulator [Actinophytocola sp.]